MSNDHRSSFTYFVPQSLCSCYRLGVASFTTLVLFEVISKGKLCGCSSKATRSGCNNLRKHSLCTAGTVVTVNEHYLLLPWYNWPKKLRWLTDFSVSFVPNYVHEWHWIKNVICYNAILFSVSLSTSLSKGLQLKESKSWWIISKTDKTKLSWYHFQLWLNSVDFAQFMTVQQNQQIIRV